MKPHLLLFLFFVAPLVMNAQVSAANVKPGLTEAELEYAKELFVAMAQSENYIRSTKCLYLFIQKTPVNESMNMPNNGADATRDDVKKVVTEWLTKHLSETDFKSVEEGVALYLEGLDFGLKSMEENAELYALMRKANAKQVREIMKPETDAMQKFGT